MTHKSISKSNFRNRNRISKTTLVMRVEIIKISLLSLVGSHQTISSQQATQRARRYICATPTLTFSRSSRKDDKTSSTCRGIDLSIYCAPCRRPTSSWPSSGSSEHVEHRRAGCVAATEWLAAAGGRFLLQWLLVLKLLLSCLSSLARCL